MITSIIVLLIVAGVAIYIIVNECIGLGDIAVTGGLFVLIELLLFLLGGMLATLAGQSLPYNTKIFEKTGEQYITALKDNKDIDSKTFILIGNVNKNLYYHYAEETDCGLKTSQKKAGQCYIVYTDETNEQPKIETYSAVKFNRWYYYIFAIPIDEYFVFYVPEGTVKRD